MTTSARITFGLTAAVIAAVLALGFVLMFLPEATQAGGATTAPTSPAAASSNESAPGGDPAESAPAPDPADPSGLPEGYVSVGHGTWIPGGEPGGCAAAAYIWIGSDNGEPMHAEMEGAGLVDMGPREFAMGEIEVDDQGRPLVYTVAPGDVIDVVGDRFCIWNGGALPMLNNYADGIEIQPGDEIILNADYATDFDYPYDTE